MPTRPASTEALRAAAEAYERHGRNATAAAAELGIARTTLQTRLQIAARAPQSRPPPFEYPKIPGERVPVEELLIRRKRQFEQRQNYEEAVKLIQVKVNVPGPIGILHFGDPHVDDDGTDVAALERHAKLVRETEGLFGANVGDTTNNWCGRLARLYAEQSTSAAEAWDLAEWFIESVDWLYIIGGNHDAWSGAGDPIKWIQKGCNSAPYMSSEVRLALKLSGDHTIRINARHDFAGSSIYNPAHGATKALTWGVRDHIASCGHKHISGHAVIKDPETGITCHALQVASYKKFDRFAKERGFRDQTLSPCALTTINTRLPPTHPDLVKVWWEPEEGADFLGFLRRQK